MPSASDVGPPTVVFFSGQVLTIVPDLPQASALALNGDKIVAVGSDQHVLALGTSDTQLIDLAGRTLLPGFVDPHNHTFQEVLRDPFPGWEDVTFDEVQERLLGVGITTTAVPAAGLRTFDGLMLLAENGSLRVQTSLYFPYNTCPTGV